MQLVKESLQRTVALIFQVKRCHNVTEAEVSLGPLRSVGFLNPKVLADLPLQ